MSYCQLEQDMDKISAFFLGLMMMAEHKHHKRGKTTSIQTKTEEKEEKEKLLN